MLAYHSPLRGRRITGMSRTPATGAHAVRAQLERILASPPFAKSERGKQFLRYIVERTLEGHAGEIKEYSIALEVFGRPDTYDPHVDATVRVEAGAAARSAAGSMEAAR
jgi:hypothetical protein